MNQKYEKIQKIVTEELSCSAHDLDHVQRVYRFCLYLAKYEPTVNIDILKTAALLHDIAKVKEDQDDSGNTDHALLGAGMAKKILEELRYIENLDQIVHCIRTHRYKGNNRPETLEAKILFDSDKIDILGPIGIARSFMIAGQYKQSIYNNISVADYIKDNLIGADPKGRIKNILKHSPNLEFEIKIKKIPENLFTAKAKEIANKRLEFMENYYEQLKNDVIGGSEY
jgi:uncharacterized protein